MTACAVSSTFTRYVPAGIVVPGALDPPTGVPSARLSRKVRSFWKNTFSDGRSAPLELGIPTAPARTSKPTHAVIRVRSTSSRLRDVLDRRNSHLQAFRDRRYWARTSDPQL